MKVYTVPAATSAMGATAAVPTGTAWVGAYDAESASYLVATSADLSSVQGASEVSEADLPTVCAQRRLQVSDVQQWRC